MPDRNNLVTPATNTNEIVITTAPGNSINDAFKAHLQFFWSTFARNNHNQIENWLKTAERHLRNPYFNFSLHLRDLSVFDKGRIESVANTTPLNALLEHTARTKLIHHKIAELTLEQLTTFIHNVQTCPDNLTAPSTLTEFFLLTYLLPSPSSQPITYLTNLTPENLYNFLMTCKLNSTLKLQGPHSHTPKTVTLWHLLLSLPEGRKLLDKLTPEALGVLLKSADFLFESDSAFAANSPVRSSASFLVQEGVELLAKLNQVDLAEVVRKLPLKNTDLSPTETALKLLTPESPLFKRIRDDCPNTFYQNWGSFYPESPIHETVFTLKNTLLDNLEGGTHPFYATYYHCLMLDEILKPFDNNKLPIKTLEKKEVLTSLNESVQRYARTIKSISKINRSNLREVITQTLTDAFQQTTTSTSSELAANSMFSNTSTVNPPSLNPQPTDTRSP